MFDEDFCNTKIKSLTDESISAYINMKSQALHLKERALQDAVRILNGVFDYAMKKDKIIMENPVSRIDMDNYYQNCDLSMKSSDEKIFTENEISSIKDRICKEMAGKTYDFIRYAMLFSIATGVRVGEIPVLKWDDITDKGVHIHRQQRSTKVKGQKKTLEELPFTKNERRHPKDGRYFPVTQRAYLLGHSVETNERFYSHMKTESLVNLKDILNRTGSTDDAQKEFTHTYSHTKIVNFGQIKNRSQWEVCERSAGIVISRQLFLPPL